MNRIAFVLFLIFSINVSAAPRECSNYVDYLDLFYINGMFTPYKSFLRNKSDLQLFQRKHISPYYKHAGSVVGAYNDHEGLGEQLLEVLEHKLLDVAENDIDSDNIVDSLSLYLINNFLSPGVDSKSATKILASAIDELSSGIESDEDYRYAYDALKATLEKCTRTIVIAHSQGNFYGNAVLSNIYVDYSYPGGWFLRDYPMLGMVNIANPTNSIGGGIGVNYPGLVGHITNDTDIIMKFVREVTGAVQSNFNASFTFDDVTGHSLYESYLSSNGHILKLKSEILKVAGNMIPVPTYEQTEVSSSAFSSYGSSEKSRILDVRFNSGSVYRYSEVPYDVISAFSTAESKGGYYNQYIRGTYPSNKIELNP